MDHPLDPNRTQPDRWTSPPGASPASREVSREVIRPRPTAPALHHRGDGPRAILGKGGSWVEATESRKHEHGAWNMSKSHETRLTCFNHQTRQHNSFVNHE